LRRVLIAVCAATGGGTTTWLQEKISNYQRILLLLYFCQLVNEKIRLLFTDTLAETKDRASCESSAIIIAKQVEARRKLLKNTQKDQD
jgi:hypothetical protein